MEGWIKLHRKFLDWEWYTDTNVKILFLHLLFDVNFEEKKRRGETIEIGETITSYQSLSDKTGLTIRQVRTAISKLKLTGEISQKTTNKCQRIKLLKYTFYQQQEEKTTNKCQTNDSQTTTPKEGKNIRRKEYTKDNTNTSEEKISRNFVPPSLQELKDFIFEKKYKIDPEKFLAYYNSNGWIVGKVKMKDWKATCVGWNKREIENPSKNSTTVRKVVSYSPEEYEAKNKVSFGSDMLYDV